ncbi:cytochrome P450 [Biscogniauxia sp. FL1348]|nr:cytochrome P450 [Biscogniauxia sp. FL1348]
MAPQVYESILTSPFLALALGCLPVLYLLYSYISSWHRLREFDGPFLASISYLWMFRTSLAGEQAARYRAVSDRYGKVSRIGPNDLLCADPEILRRMSAARSLYGRSDWYRALRVDPYVPALLNLMNTAEHDRLKARLAPGYGGKENPSIEAGVDEQIASFAALIRQKYLSPASGDGGADHLRPMDLAQKVNYFTLDVITRVAYGREFGYLKTDSDVFNYIAMTEKLVPTITMMAEIPYIGRIALSEAALRLVGPKPTDKEGMGRMMGIAQQIVGERFGPDAKDEADMLGSFIRRGVPRRQCESEVLIQIIAGSDTTATAIRCTMLNIITAPHVYYRLQREIDDAIAAGKVSSPIRADEAKDLEYLQAVIYEGLRMNLAFSGLIMKKVPPGGDTLGGRFVPAGTRVAQSILAVQRDKEIFGGDAEMFRPERWLPGHDDGYGGGLKGEGKENEEDGKGEREAWENKKRNMMQTVELVFGYGRWGCSGKNVAFLEMNKIYFELLRHFNFQLIDVKNPMRSRNHNIFFQSDMWVRVTERAGVSK